MEKEKYIPISCTFYDRLEEWATLRKECEIEYRQDSEKIKSIQGRIVDFFIKEGIEYLKLKSGEEIRLDYLISVNGETLPKSC